MKTAMLQLPDEVDEKRQSLLLLFYSNGQFLLLQQQQILVASINVTLWSKLANSVFQFLAKRKRT
jgi:hypothetical protein